MIKTTVIGYLGKDSVVSTVNNRNVINFNVCHTEKYKDAQGVEHNKSLWISCSMWRESVKVAEFLKKGTQVFVEGEPDVSIYKDANNQPTAQLKLRVSDLQLLGGKNEN
jgi:single-strand DNA-binding protein